jgi:hypothetical protein
MYSHSRGLDGPALPHGAGRQRGGLRYARVLAALAVLVVFLIGPGSTPSVSTPNLRTTMSGGGGGRRASGTSPAESDPAVDTPWLVYVLLGTPLHQVWTLDSIRQARLFNPMARLMLVHTDELYRDRNDWIFELEDLGVHLVNFTAIADGWYAEFAANYERVWKENGRGMIPTVDDGTGVGRSNLNFAALTFERLGALYRTMQVHKMTHVLHVENDQMVYGTLGRVVKGAKDCGVRLAMTRAGRTQMAPAVVYAADAQALFGLLDFMNQVLAKGAAYASEVSKSGWVTDMSLTMAYFNMHEELADKEEQELWEATGGGGGGDGAGGASAAVSTVPAANSSRGIISFPNHPDRSCMWDKLRTVFDAAALGVWCCGSFFDPHKLMKAKLDISEVAYWDRPFEWTREPAPKDMLAAYLTEEYAASWRAQVEEQESLRGDSDAADAGAGPAVATAAATAAPAPLATAVEEVEEQSSSTQLLLRIPKWDGNTIFNLHMHNKQLWRWSSLREDSGIK